MAWLSKNSFSPTDSLHADDVNNLANDIRTWGGNVNGGGYHLSNVIIDAYYPGTGVGLLSPIHVIPTSTDYSSSVHLDSEAAGNPARWILIKDQSTESGANAGSNFFLERCDDTGNVIDSPIAINRASGLITLSAQQWNGNVNGGGFTLTNVIIPSVFNDPTNTLGDMIVRGPSGIARIGVGTDGMMLTADHTQPLGVKWAVSPAVMPTRQVIAGTGLGGGGALSSDVTLTANVVTVFGRTGNVVLTAADIGGVAVPVTRSVLAGAGMSGGGALSADVTLNALVTSVFGRTGAVTLTAADISGGGGVPATRQVLAGVGMSGGGALTADVILNALVASVCGYTGAVVLRASDITGAVANTRQILTATGSGLTGGGALSADLNLSVVNDTSIQRVNWASGAGSIISTRSTLNFIQGQNITLNVVDNPGQNRADVTINSSGLTQVWIESLGTRGTPTLIGTRPGINFIGGSNVTISGVDNPTQNTVDLTFSAVGGTGTGSSQTPWLGPIDAAGETLSNVAQIGVNAAADPTGVRVAVITNSGEAGVRVVNNQTSTYSTVECDNDNATAKICLRAYGSQYGGTLQSTAGLTTGPTAPMTFSISNSEAMRISTGKRLLIGTSTDDGTHTLQIAGSIKINSPLTNGIVFADGTTQTTAITSTGMQDPTTTMGDLIVRGSTVTGRLGVGTNGQVLTARSTASSGVDWETLTPASVGAVPSTRLINTTAPLSGGGDLSADRTLSVNIGAIQTPWLQTINGGNFALSNVARIAIGGTDNGATPLQVTGTSTFTDNMTMSVTAKAATHVVQSNNFAYGYEQGFVYSGGSGAGNPVGGFAYQGYASRGLQGANIATGSGDVLVYLDGIGWSMGASGGAWAYGTRLECVAEALWTATSAPAAIVFWTTPSGSLNPTEKMRITSAGNVSIGVAPALSLLSVIGPTPSTPATANQIVIGESTNNSQYRLNLGYYLDSSLSKYRGVIQSTNNGAATGALFLQPNGGYVSIGISDSRADGNPLAVSGSAYQIRAYYTTTAQNLIIQRSSGQGVIQSQTDAIGYDPLAINPNGGNVAVGSVTGTFYYPLMVAANGAATNIAFAVQNQTTGVYGAAIAFRATDSSTTAVYSAGRIYGVFDAANFQNSRLTMGNSTGNDTFVDVLTIKNNQVSIGTIAPLAKFTVSADANPLGANNWGTAQICISGVTNNGERLMLGYDTTNDLGVIQAGHAGVAYTGLILQPNGTGVSINKTTAPGYALDVAGSINCTGQFLVNGAAISGGTSYPGVTSPGSGKLAYTAGSAVTTIGQAASTSDTIAGVAAGDCIHNITGGTNGWIFGSSGNVVSQLTLQGRWALGYSSVQVPGYLLTLAADSTQKPTTNTWNTGSDIRLKRNIRPFTEGLETILKINPIRFEYNGRMRYPEGEQCIGIDAGAHKDILPDCVSTFQDRLDDDGPVEDIFSFNPHAILFMMINAFAELAKRIEKLESSLIH